MPKYLHPDAAGIVYSPTGDEPVFLNVGNTLATPDQVYPCWDDGTPLTAEEIAAQNAPPPIPVEVQETAAKILALWAETQLSAPPDWDAAIDALEVWEDAAPNTADERHRNKVSRKLLARMIQLIQVGGTWEQVLEIAQGAA